MSAPKEILNNEEIDTLLQMFRSESDEIAKQAAGITGQGVAAATPTAPPPPPPPPPGAVTPIDLLKPTRLGREQLRGLEGYFQSAGKMLSATIGEKLRLDTRCECVAVEQMRFGAWLTQLPGPVAIYVVQFDPLKQPALLTVSTSLLYGAVDRILGGTGKVQKVPKDFTLAEHTVAEALVGPCLDRICEALADELKLTWSITSRFCNPTMAQVLPSQDVVVSVYFQTWGEFLLGDLRLMLPHESLAPLLEKFGQKKTPGMAPGALKDKVGASVRQMPVDLAVELGATSIRLRQLMELQPGDVIPLGARVGDPAVVPVMGKPKFTAHIGRIGNRFGVQVADVMGR